MDGDALSAEQKITAWMQDHLDGRVVGIERQPRWRPVWFVDLERGEELLELCVRGERTDMPMVFPLDHEMRFQSLLHGFDIPVPRVYGWIDDPRAYVMDRVAGREDFATASEAQRRAVVDHYLRILARLHALPLAPFEAAGIRRAAVPAEAGRLGTGATRRSFARASATPNRSWNSALAGCIATGPIHEGVKRRCCGTVASSIMPGGAWSPYSTSNSAISVTR